MLRLKINSSKFGDGWSIDFETQEELDQYLADIGDKWGTPPSQQIIPEVVDMETGEILQQEEIIEIPGTWSYEIEDITEQFAKEQLAKQGLERQELGSKIVAAVYAINEGKQISAEQFGALLADANIQRIERLLWSGSLKTAKLLIAALDGTYFSTEEKSSILAMLADY